MNGRCRSRSSFMTAIASNWATCCYASSCERRCSAAKSARWRRLDPNDLLRKSGSFMPVLYCPRCQRSNPEIAEFCYFDGAELRSRQDGSFHRLGQEFVFPSGRRCRTFDDFAQGCRDEWPAARDLLRQGVFKQFFGGTGRTDLAQVAHEAMAQQDADIALTTFLDALP